MWKLIGITLIVLFGSIAVLATTNADDTSVESLPTAYVDADRVNRSAKRNRGSNVTFAMAPTNQLVMEHICDALENRRSIVTDITPTGIHSVIGTHHECGAECELVTYQYKNNDGSYSSVHLYTPLN